MDIPQKLKVQQPQDPAISTSRHLSEEIENTNLKIYMHLYVHCSVIYNSKDMEATYVVTDR